VVFRCAAGRDKVSHIRIYDFLLLLLNHRLRIDYFFLKYEIFKYDTEEDYCSHSYRDILILRSTTPKVFDICMIFFY